MTAYIIRRLLWMIPTFAGILLINFAVLRLQGPTLAQEMSRAVGGEGAKADMVAAGVESYIGKFRATGLDLPAIFNLRGFASKSDVVAWLNSTVRGPGASEHLRNAREKELWIAGRFYVEPLIEVLQDDNLFKLHGPASMALSLCAFQPLTPDELAILTPDQRARRQARNATLKNLRIEHTNTEVAGFVTTDANPVAKRAAITAFWKSDGSDFARSDRWRALLCETGFADFAVRLATGTLYSHARQEYVFTMIGDRWATTFWLNLAAMVIAWGISIPIGIRSARRIGS